MNRQFLIDAIVRQTTVLIAQLATAGGARAPLAHVASQVFVDLTRALEEQGVSRKVGADMFGMALRAYIRKIGRLREGATVQGRSLWEAVLAYISERPLVGRNEVLKRFANDDEVLVRGVLHDLVDSGLMFCIGTGNDAAYRVPTDEELRQMSRMPRATGSDELLWVVIYREGPITRDAMLARGGAQPDTLDAALQRLAEAKRIHKRASGEYVAGEFFVDLSASSGAEAAIFDHYHALVKTLCCKISPDPSLSVPAQAIGGSTYTYDVWPDHPLYTEVIDTLRRAREASSELRRRVDLHNASHAGPKSYLKVVTYAGQCVLAHDTDEVAVEQNEVAQ